MLACWLRHVGTYLAAESTVLKRPSNGDPEMRELTGCRTGLPVKICWLFLFVHFSSGQARCHSGAARKSVAPVFLEASANNVDSCAGGDL